MKWSLRPRLGVVPLVVVVWLLAGCAGAGSAGTESYGVTASALTTSEGFESGSKGSYAAADETLG
jgi:hypothetical protein